MAPVELALMGKNFSLVELLMEKYGCRVSDTVLKVHVTNTYMHCIIIIYSIRKTTMCKVQITP